MTQLRLALGKAARIGAGSLAATTAVSCAATAYAYQTDESWKRLIDFHVLITPTCWDYYKFYTWGNQNPSDLEAMHQKHAPLALQHVLELGGYYVKCAQMFCGMNLLPPAYEKEFSCLLDQVPARHDFETIRSIVETELGGSLEDHFVDFCPQPMAAASIGQVHAAQIRDPQGRLVPVVVKVQYPEVEGFFRLDVQSLQNLCHLCTKMGMEIGIDQKSLDKVFGEFTHSFEEEFDYRKEAQNLELVADNLQRVPRFAHRVRVPRPFLDKTSPKVLTMERLPGEPIQKRTNRMMQEWADREGKTLDELKKELERKFQDPEELQKLMQQKPPSPLEMWAYKSLLRAWDMGGNLKIWLGNRFSSKQQQKPYQWSTLPVDAAQICNLLFEVHAHQLFVDGAFNADPHAGNILICEDKNGSVVLGLIDFGNVQRIPDPQRRRNLARFYLAMAEDYSHDPTTWNDQEIAQRFVQVGGASVHNDAAFLACNALTMYDMRLDATTLGRFGIKADMSNIMEVYESDTFEEFPADLVNLQRLCQTLVGVAGIVGAGQPSCARMWKKQCEQLVEDSQPA